MAEAPRRALGPALRQLESVLQRERLDSSAHRRIQAALDRGAEPRRRWARRIASPLIFAAAGFAAMVWARTPVEAPKAMAPVPTLGAFQLRGEHCLAYTDGGDTKLEGECRLVASGLRVDTGDGTVVRVHDRVLEVRDGTAGFDVDKVPAGQESVRVVVSHGVIEVVGTRFTVRQRPAGGDVELHEGRIRFHDHHQQRVTELAPGDRHVWGALATAEATSEAQVNDTIIIVDDPDTTQSADTRRPRPKNRPRSRHQDPTKVIEELSVLRADGRYSDAVALLRRALRRQWDRRTTEILSYELGELLWRHLGDSDGACRHLRSHQKRFPRGRYAGAIRTTMIRLGCPQT